MNIFTVALASESAVSTNTFAGAAGGMVNLLPMVAIFLVFYFLLIRPQMKKQKELQSMVDTLKKGDKVIAAGGIVGKIIKIEDDIVSLEIDANTKIQVMKNSVTECLSAKKASEGKK